MQGILRVSYYADTFEKGFQSRTTTARVRSVMLRFIRNPSFSLPARRVLCGIAFVP